MQIDVTDVKNMIKNERVSVIASSSVEKMGYSKIYLAEEAIKDTGLNAIFIDCSFFHSGYSFIKNLVETQGKDTLIFSNLFQLNTKKAAQAFIEFIEMCKFKMVFLSYKDRSIHKSIQKYLNNFPTTELVIAP
ncbi:hypothetical protein [Priestia aryabhattai]